MSGQPLAAVVGVGVCSSLGLDAESSLAGVEAGLSRMVRTAAFMDEDGDGGGDDLDDDRDHAVCAPLELLPLDTARGRRIHWLAGTAYLDLIRRFPDWKRVELPIVLVGPEPSADHDVPRDFMITHLRELSDAAVPRPVGDDWWVAGGRGGWFGAARRALEALAAGESLVALAAVDTDCDPDSLRRLSRRGAVLSDENPRGRIAGEGAVFVLLARPEIPRQLGVRPWAWLGGLRGGSEPRHLLQPRSTMGEGLTRLFAQLRAQHPSWRADAVYSAQPMNSHFGRELKLAALRHAALLPEPMALVSLHDELGDCGAASAPLLLAFAALRFARERQARPEGPGLRRVLIYGESDDGTLGACLVEAGERAAKS